VKTINSFGLWCVIAFLSFHNPLNAQSFERERIPALKIIYTSSPLLKATGYIYNEDKNIWCSNRRLISKYPWYLGDYNGSNNFKWAKVLLIEANDEKRVVLIFKIKDYYYEYPNIRVGRVNTWKYQYINVSITTYNEFINWLKSDRDSKYILGSSERCGSIGNEAGNRSVSINELYTDINKANLKIPSQNYWSNSNHGDYGSQITFYKKGRKVRFNLPFMVMDIFGEPNFGEENFEDGPSSYFESEQDYLIRIFTL